MTVTEQTTGFVDSTAIAMAKAGHEAAINHLVETYRPQAYRAAKRILRSHEDAEEVAQDAIWTAIRHLSTFREDASFRTWLQRIIVNHSLMVIRRRRSRALDSAVPFCVEAEPESMKKSRSPEDLLLDAERREILADALRKLSTGYSVPLQISAQQGKSAREIAHLLGATTSAVKARLHRGRSMLCREVDRLSSTSRAQRKDSEKTCVHVSVRAESHSADRTGRNRLRAPMESRS